MEECRYKLYLFAGGRKEERSVLGSRIPQRGERIKLLEERVYVVTDVITDLGLDRTNPNYPSIDTVEKSIHVFATLKGQDPMTI